MATTLPEAWHEVENPEHIIEKYRAQDPTLFVRQNHDVGVYALPISTSSPHDDDRYRANAIRGTADEFEHEFPVGTYEDHERALERALEFAGRAVASVPLAPPPVVRGSGRATVCVVSSSAQRRSSLVPD